MAIPDFQSVMRPERITVSWLKRYPEFADFPASKLTVNTQSESEIAGRTNLTLI